MKGYAIIFIVIAFVLVAWLLGLRDKWAAKKAFLEAVKDKYGKAPENKYRENDFEHIAGYYRNHRDGFSIDDITWNDLNMDSVYKRMNYCYSAAGEEYLYYMLRTPKQSDDFESFEKQVKFISENDEFRRNLQLTFYNIGKSSRYSIYDYLDYLKNVKQSSNFFHYIMLLLLAAAVGIMFFYFTVGFVLILILMTVQIVSYFRIKSEIEPFLVTYNYVMRVIQSVDGIIAIKEESFREDVKELGRLKKDFAAFRAGASILLSPTRMNSGGNPVDLLLDYIRMITHLDIIKFNLMYVQLMEKRDRLDRMLTIIGSIEAGVSAACFRASFEGKYCVPVFEGDSYKAKGLIHPLLEKPVDNDIETVRGVLLTGSNASGKSTFLKTCAINALLAQSVHTVLGQSYNAPFFRIYSSMALKDDILEGDSYYIVEIKSIKRIIDAAMAEGAKVLCFVDEVLRGTNTLERIAASTQILSKLADEKVMCFAATHDIELTSLLDDKYDICHFEGDIEENDVRFDYKLKKGPATTRNAIRLLAALGYDESIVNDAQKMADNFQKNGTWEKSCGL
ncbi:MAG: hypothetical protein K6E91_05260 [Butyrivibrio sp.]|nr:hypothetical protein [Butyrivibrio sp.]